MYENRDDFIRELSSSVRNEQNHRELAEYDRAMISDLRKKLSNAPMIGCGAGLVLITGGIVTGKVPPEGIYALVPSLWCFFIGVIASFFTVFFNLLNFNASKEKSIKLGNSQDVFLMIYDHMRENGFSPSQQNQTISFSPDFDKKIDEAIKEQLGADDYSKKSDKYLKFVGISFGLSALLFAIGVALPLTFFTTQSL